MSSHQDFSHLHRLSFNFELSKTLPIMSNAVAGDHTNGTLDDDANREVKGHLLFEIATEVANRGQ